MFPSDRAYKSDHSFEVHLFTSFCIATIVPQPCPEGSLQLGYYTDGFNEDGNYFVQGRVEQCLNSTYGAYCDIDWDDADAAVPLPIDDADACTDGNDGDDESNGSGGGDALRRPR